MAVLTNDLILKLGNNPRAPKGCLPLLVPSTGCKSCNNRPAETHYDARTYNAVKECIANNSAGHRALLEALNLQSIDIVFQTRGVRKTVKISRS